MVIILQLLLLEKYRGPDLGDLNGRYGPAAAAVVVLSISEFKWYTIN